MAVRPEEVEAALVDTVCSRIGERVPAELAEQTEAFVRRYYHWVPQEELAGRSPGDLLGAASAQLELLVSRLPGEAKVRVYNPEPERDGWQSPHTVVEIVSDDMPFLVDSVSMELTRLQYGIHLLIHPVIDVRRDSAGRLVEVTDPGAEEAVGESVMHAEIDRETDPDRLEALEHSLREVLAQVAAAVEDWPAMRACLSDAAAELAAAPQVPAGHEASAFLEWLGADKFVFLGYREYALVRAGGEDQLQAVEGTGLGILRHGADAPVSPSSANPSARVRARARGPEEPLVLTKADSRSPVHRPLYLDYVGVKRFAASGAVIGERRFVGLYTTTAEKASTREVPVLRGKVDAVLRRAGFPPASHDSKALLDILESYPRDELFPIDEDELFDAAMAILALGERQRVRLLVRHDAYERFVSCLVYIPRDRFNTANREAIEAVLREAFAATSVDWTVRVSESVLVRLHFVVRLGPDSPRDVDVHEVEERLVEATRSWIDDLHDVLHSTHDQERADVLFQRYRSAFPPAYRADYPARRTVDDIIRVELAAASGRIDMRVYQPPGSAPGSLRCKLYSPLEPVILSDILPIFELMGAQVADERPYEVRSRGHPPVWIYDLRLIYPGEFEIDSMAFRDAFIGVWSGELENDRLGALVGKVGLPGREVSLLRAIAKYLRQAGMTFSDRYLQQALTENPEIARQLVELFRLRFDPARHDAAAAERLAREIEQAIDAVPSLDQDRILRNYLATVGAVLRTNYFRPGRAYLSFKLDPSRLSFLPLPRPAFEIFVYSPRVEGIHLRGGKVARGGLRWSDRLEDFRVEVLGLMKAQTVKNALIVPVGAKGGFVVKRPPAEGGREALRAEVVACYQTFIRGLLDVTDNIVAGEVVAPDDVVRYDEDDPYLVVAADKGTATLSDLANGVAAEYGFWLGDAFASGGSHGYDHKRMGITARGAWESVKRHFRELGVDTQATDFTVAGIGDMGGDVFGNGMLLSRHIRLVAAFNHEHVFLDPNPDPAASFDERRRLFEAASSSWLDYNPELISPGGGVFSRTAKHVELSPEAREALGVEVTTVTPNELIRAVLRAPLDLLWNGGIGTFVKSLGESHADAGDKANDAVRIDASELRCRVVGEGGNLGLTQRARIEFALAGGRVNTDAIDNVAGVNTSDTEVNLKILLDAAVADGELTVDERNEVLGGLAEAVAQRVIGQSYGQTLGLSLERARAPETIDMHGRLIRRLEGDGQLDRALEFLPSDEEIDERKLAGNGLTMPELAVVSAYAKNALHAVLLGSDVTDDEYLADELVESLPPSLARFRKQMQGHRLRGDIIATQLANDIVDRAGLTFAFRMAEENDVPAADIARAYATALVAFDVRGLWAEVKALDGKVDAAVQYGMLFEARRLIGRVTRWLLTDSRRPIRIVSSVERIRPAAETLAGLIPDVLHGLARDAWQARLDELSAAGVPSRIARRSAAMGPLFAALDVADIAGRTERSLDAVATAYFELASELELHWLADRILELPRPDLLQTLARAGLRDDLYRLRRDLTADALGAGGVDRWLAQNADAVEGSAAMLADIKLGGIFDVTTLSVGLRALHKLVQPAAAGGR